MNSPGAVAGRIGEAEALAMAGTAACLWGPLAEPPALINIRENMVFRLRFADGRLAALRLHRPGYQSRTGIESELEWTGKLAACGLAVPAPIANVEGKMTATCGDRLVSVVCWLEGQPMGASATALAGSTRDQVIRFNALGALAGDLHRITDDLSFKAGFTRPAWDAEGLLGPKPFWGRFWDNPAFGPEDIPIILAARDQARLTLANIREDYGLIHADLLRENILISGNRMALIDFDDSGYGFRLYDLGTALVQNLEEPHLPELVAALVAGYRRNRPAPGLDPQHLVLFTLLRCLASAGWIASRAEANDPRQNLYAGRALRLAGHFLEGTAPW
jgi:Ser/Thr protein kinase RdoA (MazF antagonist)